MAEAGASRPGLYAAKALPPRALQRFGAGLPGFLGCCNPGVLRRLALRGGGWLSRVGQLGWAGRFEQAQGVGLGVDGALLLVDQGACAA